MLSSTLILTKIQSSKYILVIWQLILELMFSGLVQSLFMLILKHQSCTVNLPSALRYLHGSIDSRVCSQAEVSSRDVVADGSRDYTHGDAELIITTAGFKQLQHTSVPL